MRTAKKQHLDGILTRTVLFLALRGTVSVCLPSLAARYGRAAGASRDGCRVLRC